jgi:Transposase IS116/IS110/IS902 family
LRGVDLIVAVTFVTEVGDVSRFESPRQLMAYLGLVPSERSTGDTVRHHQGRERPGPTDAGGKCLDLSPSAAHRHSQTLPAGGDDAKGP